MSEREWKWRNYLWQWGLISRLFLFLIGLILCSPFLWFFSRFRAEWFFKHFQISEPAITNWILGGERVHSAKEYSEALKKEGS